MKAKTLYECFLEYTEEQVNAAVAKLSENEIIMLKIKFGEDFKHPRSVPSYITHAVFGTILRKIKNILIDPSYKMRKSVRYSDAVMALVEQYKNLKNQKDSVLNAKPEDTTNITEPKKDDDTVPIKPQNGSESSLDVVESEAVEKGQEVASLNDSNLSNDDAKDTDYSQKSIILMRLMDPSFEMIVSMLSTQEVVAVAKRFEEMALAHNVGKKEALDIYRKVLTLYKNSTLKTMDDLIDDSGKTIEFKPVEPKEG